MRDAVGPEALADYKTATLRNAWGAVAGATLIGAVLVGAWLCDAPPLRGLLPDPKSMQVALTLPLALLSLLLVIGGLSLVMWWNTRSLMRAEARILHRLRVPNPWKRA